MRVTFMLLFAQFRNDSPYILLFASLVAIIVFRCNFMHVRRYATLPLPFSTSIFLLLFLIVNIVVIIIVILLFFYYMKTVNKAGC